MRLYGLQQGSSVDPQQAARFEDDAGRYWDLFYKRNSDRFFKDRHYFDKEWPQLTQPGALTVLEVGCGAGNSVFPLLELNPQLRVFACDFSPRAVELVKAHPQYAASGRVTAFVADITQHEGPGALSQQLPGPCADFCSMVFVLSAVAPHRMRQALRNVALVLKPGRSRVLFRDYAEGDLAQTRLEDSSAVKHICGNFYARGDGTCCYYFDQDELSALFAAEGFVCEASIIHARELENRKSGVKMPRRWIQAVFRYDPVQQPPQPLPAQLQQQQQPPPSQEQPSAAMRRAAQAVQQHCQVLGSSSTSSSSTFECAGKTWLLPPNHQGRHDGCSCSECSPCVCAAHAVAGLAEQQALQLLGRRVLIAPPWLRLAPHQQQPGCLQCGGCGCQVTLLQPPAAAAYCSGTEVQQQGAAAALLALLVVWLGARRVCVCLPGADDGGFAAAFHAVIALNECSVVVERIRTKQWPQGSSTRRVGALCRELLVGRGGGGGSGGGVVLVAQQADRHSVAATTAVAAAAPAGPEVQQLVDAVCAQPQAQVVMLGLHVPGC